MMKTKATLLPALIAVLTLVFISACNPFESDDNDNNSDGIVESTTEDGYSDDAGNSSDDATDNDNSGDFDNDAASTVELDYAENGPYRSTWSNVEKEDVDGNYGLTIFYPLEMTDGSHPIITWGNGTSAPTFSYQPLLKHLATWGFVVVATDCMNTLSGEEMIAGIDYLIEQNGTPGSPFHNKLDTGRIGATGHSQGGGGAINAANDPRVVCSAPMAPAPGNARGLSGPMLLIAGDQDTVVLPFVVEMSFNGAKVPTLYVIRKGIGHFDFIGAANNVKGYLTAWFMYQLQDDADAALAFEDGCEICSNPNWIVDTGKWFVE